EGKKPIATVDQSDLEAKRHKNGSVFAANDATTNYGQAFGYAVHLQKGVGVEGVDIVEGDLRRAMRLRARGDEDHIALEPARAVGSRDHNRVTVFEGRLAANELNLVQRQILQNPAALHVHDFAFVMHEVVHSEILFERVIDAIKTALFQAREIERRFAQSLAGNGTSIDATAAQVLGAFDQGDALAKIGGSCINTRSEEHTSELQSRGHLVCRLLLENKNTRARLRLPRASCDGSH